MAYILSEECQGCGGCMTECPIPGAMTFNRLGVVEIDPTLCTDCGRCECPFGLILSPPPGEWTRPSLSSKIPHTPFLENEHATLYRALFCGHAHLFCLR